MLKIKPLTKDQIIISLDRLTRFKHTEVKYLRVFKDIITSNLILPKYKKNELDCMDYREIKELAQEIFNNTLGEPDNLEINQKLFDYENSIFILDENTKELLKNKINYASCLKLIDENSPNNLKWLKNLANSDDAKIEREKSALHFPIEKVVISEGITEEILLPEFAKLWGYDFDKNGVHIISAGGKNQVVKLFYTLSQTLKLPIFILLDRDAKANYDEIKPKLRTFDKVHVLKNGEFEDVLKKELIHKTLSYGLENISLPPDIESGERMTKVLEEIFRHRGLHEFKKSEFAQTVKKCLTSSDDISPEIADIIEKIKRLDKKSKEMVDN